LLPVLIDEEDDSDLETFLIDAVSKDQNLRRLAAASKSHLLTSNSVSTYLGISAYKVF